MLGWNTQIGNLKTKDVVITLNNYFMKSFSSQMGFTIDTEK